MVIILRNLDKDRGICNGVRCLVLKVSLRMLDVRILSGRSAGSRIILPRIPFRSQAGELPFQLRRRQFPVRLAWAMSVHKAQGSTLHRCGIYLPQPVFTHGQLYVSASRTSSAGGLRFWLGDSDGHGFYDDTDNEHEGPYTHNVVYSAIRRFLTSGDILAPTLSEEPIGDATDDEGATASMNEIISPPGTCINTSCNEFIELTAGAQDILNQQLLHGSGCHPADSGADLADEDHPKPVAPAHTFHGYFERQVQAHCGLHALNNAMGGSVLSVSDMAEACTAYLAESRREHFVERREDHSSWNGWYSEATMAFVFRWKIARHALGRAAKLKLDLNKPIQPTHESGLRIYEEDTLGVVVNKQQSHWVTFKIEHGEIWLLDSGAEPVCYSYEKYIAFLEMYRNAFALVDES